MDTRIPTDVRKKQWQTEQIHLKDYLNIIRKRKRVVILFSAALIGLVAAYSFTATPVYEATAQIIIEREMYPITRAEQALSTDNMENDFYQTQYALLQSRGLALKVIKDLELWKEFQSEEPSKVRDSATEVKSSGNAPVPEPGQKTVSKDQGNIPFTDWSDAIDWYLDSLKIVPVKESRLININFRSRSPETAARAANAHARLFIERNIQTKIAASQQKLSWMMGRPQGGGTTSPDNQPRSFSVDDKNIFSLPEVAQDAVIQNLRNLLIQLKTKRLEQITNYGPKHPKMIDLNSQISQVEQEINAEVRRLIRTVNSSFENSNISIVDEAEVPLDPVKPRRFLNIFMAMMISMFMGPFLAFFVEYMDRTVKTPADVEQRLGMAMLGAVPVYRSSRKRGNGLLAWDDVKPDKKSDRKRRYHYAGHMAVRFIPGLLSIRKEAEGDVLFIESATSGEGKTTVLANSAISLARRGLRVLAIDGDIFNPALHTAFGLGYNGGLVSIMSEILSQEVLKGDLKTYSVDDLFFLIALNRLGGSLRVTNESQAMTALFEDGRLLLLRSEKSPTDNRLGGMLVRSGLITEGQLEDALDWHKRTGQPLGYVLVNGGYLSPERLQGPLRLHMEEQLQRLFSWKKGTFEFEAGANAQAVEDVKSCIREDYTQLVRRFGRGAGSRFIEQAVLSRILPTAEPNVSLLPAGATEAKPNFGPAFQTVFAKVLQVLKSHFDVIFVDAPPVLDMPDSAVLSRQGDGVMFVVKAGKLTDKAITAAATRLEESGSKILGVVLNQARLDKEQY